MGGFDRGQDAFGAAALGERVERIVVTDRFVAHAADDLEQRVLRADTRIVEPRGNRVRLLDLTVRILQQERITALQHPRRAVGERGGVLPETAAAATGLETEQLDSPVAD